MLNSVLRGARTNNLKAVDLELCPGLVVAVTGVSGAGKSSLAMDTLYAEGQRRFVESFSPYARQFLERLERPPVESLEPVPAGVAVDRRAPIKSSRSTVATMADLEPYLTALFVRESVPVCPEHHVEATALDPNQAADHALGELPGEHATVTYPVRAADPEAYLELREQLSRDGYRRLWVNGRTEDIDRIRPSAALAEGPQVEVVVDRLRLATADRARLADALEHAWRASRGTAFVHTEGAARAYRQGLCCPRCGRGFAAARPGLLSYNSPLGACPTCRGFGRVLGIDPEKVVPDPSRSLKRKAIRPWSGPSTRWERSQLRQLCERHSIPMDVAWSSLTERQQRLVFEGDGDWDEGRFPGVLGWFRWLESRTYKLHVRVLLARYRAYEPCPACGGRRFNAQALLYRVGGLDLAAWHALEVREAYVQLQALEGTTGQGRLARQELLARLSYLDRVGLGYLTLDRQARTLSGGEAQRVTLTAALGTSLHHALFVLDEPTVGLHATDVEPLNGIMRELASRGNTVLVVEHDPLVLRSADRILELGPGAGERGGELTFDGAPADLAATGGATARALAPRPPSPSCGAAPTGHLHVRGARANNLAGFDVGVPLGVVCAVTGPSGSGKSTLAVDIVYRGLARLLHVPDTPEPGAHDRLEGAAQIRRVRLVDQSPLGRTSRGNPATYTKAWDVVRKRFAAEPSARALGLSPAHFSFNVAGGRCEACSGEGYETVEMQFLADVRLVCPSCRGRRFTERVLSVNHRGRSIADWLELTVDAALAELAEEPSAVRALGPVSRLGLGYLRLGQPLSTLSGGEAQRLKLARALADRHRDTLFVLDEPSAGLHADEVGRLLECCRAIVDAGGSVLLVEHDLDVVCAADHLIDLGPGAGRDGGKLVAEGSPATVARTNTRTGRALRERSSPVAFAGPTPSPPQAERPALEVLRAREHNLRDVSVSIPHRALTVITGPSGSGKSTLAFDVVFAEGQRRFLETLTPYARQFLPTLPRPDADRVTGVPPSVALEQRTSRAGPKSTVATVTEVAHYLRLLYAKLGVVHCPEHDQPIRSVSVDEIFDTVRRTRGTVAVLAPAVAARKGTYLDLFTAAARAGIVRARCDGQWVSTDSPPRLARNREHDIDLEIEAALSARRVSRGAVERALRWGRGSLKLRHASGEERLVSSGGVCPQCGFAAPELDPRWFSFNTQQGRCASCDGTGQTVVVARRGRRRRRVQTVVPGPCSACEGSRLAPVPRAVRLQGMRYHEFSAQPVDAALKQLRRFRFGGAQARIAGPVVAELERRLQFLADVGLTYLSLDRAAPTLSGGEIQRLRLAAQLGAGLTGALYVLDEPTIGLHPVDTGRLLGNLSRLVDLGSTVVVVEHDESMIRAADHLVDLGPGGGADGGRVLAVGPPSEVLRDPQSPTGHALTEPSQLRAALPAGRGASWLTLEGAAEHNLRGVDLRIPHARMTVVAGVSGSGKSTLVRQVLLPALRSSLGLATDPPGQHLALTGVSGIRRATAVDQSPIGRTPRSVPATFLGIWDAIRALYASTPDAMVSGFSAARFSFNTPSGGRCETCEGQGAITHEMSFLPDVVVTCPTCEGKRFEPRTLEVKYRGYSIGDVLALTAAQAADLFANHPRIAGPLRTLTDLGAGYVTLGQGSPTLSGGEAQRLKLAAELTATARHEPTLYVLDEPTTGLHLADVARLMDVLGRLVERGDTLVVIEHHPTVIAGADWVVELGPGGGHRGGRVVAQGTPATVARRRTATAQVLREVAFPGR